MPEKLDPGRSDLFVALWAEAPPTDLFSVGASIIATEVWGILYNDIYIYVFYKDGEGTAFRLLQCTFGAAGWDFPVTHAR